MPFRELNREIYSGYPSTNHTLFSSKNIIKSISFDVYSRRDKQKDTIQAHAHARAQTPLESLYTCHEAQETSTSVTQPPPNCGFTQPTVGQTRYRLAVKSWSLQSSPLLHSKTSLSIPLLMYGQNKHIC